MLFKKRTSNAELNYNELVRIIQTEKVLQAMECNSVEETIWRRLMLETNQINFSNWVYDNKLDGTESDFAMIKSHFSLSRKWTKDQLLKITLNEWLRLYNTIDNRKEA